MPNMSSMGFQHLYRLASFPFFLLLALLAASPARATENVQSRCWASGPLVEHVVTTAMRDDRWHCGQPYSIQDERIYLRFDIAADQPAPRYLLTRRSAVEAIQILVIERSGQYRHVEVPPDEWQNSKADGIFRVELPPINAEARQVVIVFDRPSHRMALEQAYLAAGDPADDEAHIRKLILLAALCGMLAMPLVFNMAVYRVLREPFVLWHSALVISLMLTVALSSGLGGYLLAFRVMTLSWMSTLVFGLSVAAGVMFTYSFVEPERMHLRLRSALPICAVVSVALSGFHAAFPFVARPVQSTIYTAAFAPILLIFMWALLDALKRGSRAAKYQAVGWLPIMVVGLIRLTTGLVPTLSNNDAMLLFYFGCIFEVLSTSMGVADRFMSLKHQRDRAKTEAETLERIAEHDALTGLLNRRALSARFRQSAESGFDKIAVLDLDHFKNINDQYGHGAGDAVIKAAAAALQPDENIFAFRMGGEEFVLLLRGADAEEQAEKRRRAISAQVRQHVPHIKGCVTASMGIADIGTSEFETAFERADRLLYAAKLAGRNRTNGFGLNSDDDKGNNDVSRRPRALKSGAI